MIIDDAVLLLTFEVARGCIEAIRVFVFACMNPVSPSAFNEIRNKLQSAAALVDLSARQDSKRKVACMFHGLQAGCLVLGQPHEVGAAGGGGARGFAHIPVVTRWQSRCIYLRVPRPLVLVCVPPIRCDCFCFG